MRGRSKAVRLTIERTLMAEEAIKAFERLRKRGHGGRTVPTSAVPTYYA